MCIRDSTNSLANQTTGDGKNVTAGNQTASLIEDTGPGPMIFKSDGGGGPGAFQFFDADWRPLIRMYSGGTQQRQVSLYYNNERRLSTNSVGVEIEGSLGIGIDNPAGMLEVQKNGVPAIISNYNNSKHIQMDAGGSGAGFQLTTGHYFAINHQPYADRGTNNNLDEKFRIDSSGNLLRGGTGQDIGANGAPWDKIYAGEFIGDIRKTQTELILSLIHI